MKVQGSNGLWLLAIVLIALFMLATMIAPAMVHQSTGGTGNNTDGGGNSQALMFNTPTMVLGSSTIEQDGTTGLSVKAMPESTTTGNGGSYVWILSVEGTNGQGNAFQVRYGDQLVQWFAGDNGALVGIGPRFTQGPGATSVEASASMNVSPLAPGSYTIKAWVAVGKDLVSLDPSGLEACSPVASQSLQVSEKTKTEAKVIQTLDGPSTAEPSSTKYVRFTLTSSGHATGMWKGTVADKLTIFKSGIGRTDVRLRVIGGSGSVSLSDKGDYLEATLQTTRPFDGSSSSEDAEWSVTFELLFTSAGTYVVETSAVDTYSGGVLSTPISHTVVVAKAPSTAPTSSSTPSTPTNATVTAPPTPVTAPATPTATTPTDGTDNATVPNGTTTVSDDKKEDNEEKEEKEDDNDKSDG